MTIGAIKITVPAKTAAAIFNRNDQASFINNSSATAQPTHKYNGFTRNQHAIPSATPAARASHTLFRCAARINNQLPPSTNHVVGTSGDGYAAYIANSGESAIRNPLAIAARGPNAVAAMPAISKNERSKSANHKTNWTEYAE